MFNGDLLNELRRDRGLSQDDLAEALGVSRGSITNYETNKTVPEIAVQIVICDYFRVSLDYINGRTDIPYSYGINDYLALPPGLTKAQKREVAQFAEFVKNRDKK